ncbi:MAG: EpsG family protein [Lachnospiraceae bacterium]|nr:EpsG family protein [Lachnospiraceae bacterium]
MQFVNTRQEKNVRNVTQIICAIWLLILWRILAFSPVSTDSDSYRLIFSANSNRYGTELGFYLLIRIAHLLNQNYWTFRAICLGVAFVFLYLTIIEAKTNGIYFLMAYTFYPLLIDAIQFRFLLALSIELFALAHLENGNKLRSSGIKYIVITIAASFIHASVIVFLIYLIAYYNSTDKFKKIFCLSLLIECAVILLIQFFGPFVNNIMLFFRSSDFFIYQFGLDYSGWIKYVLIYMLLLVISTFYLHEQYEQTEFEKYIRILLLGFLMINLTLLNENLNRYFRASVILVFLLIGKQRNKFTFNSAICRSAILICSIILYVKFINGDILTAWKGCFLGFSSLRDIANSVIRYHYH